MAISNFSIGQILSQLEMYSNDTPVPSFFWVREKEKVKDQYIRLALERAREFNVDAVYFRFFQGRPPVPQIYIYDYTSQSLDEQARDDVAQKQRRIWSSCQVPLLYVLTKTDIQIFNTYQKPTFDDEENVKYNPYQLIKIAGEVDEHIKLKDFSARSFDNGAFWEKDEYRKDFEADKGAYESLITELRYMRRKVVDIGLTKKIAHRLLVTAILIKYLEEREDEEGRTVFPKAGEKRRSIDSSSYTTYNDDFFARYAEGATEFIDVLRGGKIVQLYHDLSLHFNGKVFQLTAKEEKEIKASPLYLSSFADFLEGKTQTGGQLTLWRMYSFKDLPVELISNIYEEFIEDKSGGVVYTPPFLVNFLLDEVLPLTDNDTNVKILDPACGSGIFLVQAYKRLIYRWKSANNWQNPSLDILKGLLRSNIYGADIKEDAVKLAVFSLTVALCDELSPLEIWNDLRFDDLDGYNLQANDLFELVQNKNIANDFDLIVGNPPFSRSDEWTNAAKKIEADRIADGEERVPTKQLALLFLNQAMKLTKQGADICLILPSGPFLYNLSSFAFRKQFLESYNLRYIADFTHLSRFLFGKGKGDHPTLAVFAKNEPPTEKDILHITVRRTRTAKAKVWFELDHYDFHWVRRGIALSGKDFHKIIWKSNFIGGGRAYSLILRLISCGKSLSAYIEERKDLTDKVKRWFFSEGFTVGGSDAIHEADYLTGEEYILSSALTESGVNEDKKEKIKARFFSRPRTRELYEPPLLLIKKSLGNKSLLTAFRDQPTKFRNRIVGISAPPEDKKQLINISEYFVEYNKTLFFLILGCSSELLIRRSSAIQKSDLDILPYPEDKTVLNLSELEEVIIDDTLEYFLPYRREYANLTKIEKKPTNNQLKEFGDTFLQVLNSIYKDYKSGQWMETSSHIVYPFYWGDAPELPQEPTELSKHLESLMHYEQPSGNLRFVRVARIYQDNVIYLIKPKQLRYWLRSIALRDADETFASLVKQEYELSPA